MFTFKFKRKKNSKANIIIKIHYQSIKNRINIVINHKHWMELYHGIKWLPLGSIKPHIYRQDSFGMGFLLLIKLQY